jgi:nitroimidazol reductase NimA-like FMN-containing flavoprotein (pyridoxamine 5'-phosphate oxidase superfamily)
MKAITEKTRISRSPKRGDYSGEMIYSILDEGLFCHVAYVENGQPMMIPTGYGRVGDKLYIHGSVGSHFMRAIADGRPVVLTVSLIDGLVLARSAFHHSVNYRSVVAFASGTVVTDDDERWEALRIITEHVVPGRWDDVRWPSASEMKKTMVISFPLDEASAKLRTVGVLDDEEDLNLPAWAGILPLRLMPGEPQPDPQLAEGTAMPGYVSGYKRGSR